MNRIEIEISEEELEFNQLEKKYYERFGERYPLFKTDTRPLSEHIQIIRKCLGEGKRREIVLDPNVTY